MLDDLEAGEPYAVSVAMYNGVRSVYGLPAHATPASLTPAAAPSPPRTVAIKPLGEGALNVTWTPPVDDGGARVTAYRVEWDSSEAVHEVQRVKFKATDIVGAFALAFQGATTPPIPAGASGERLKTALEALPTIGEVDVTKGAASYDVVFRTNVGDVPALAVSVDALRDAGGAAVAAEVEEVPRGLAPAFDEGTLGIYRRPLGSGDVARRPEVQEVAVGAKAADVNGYFRLSYGGQTSNKIYADASAQEMATALDDLKTLGPVMGSVRDVEHRTTEPVQHAARVWRVTCDAALGDVPSRLVDTGGGGTQFNEAVGAHGHLKGTSPFANVTEAQKGGLPRWVAVGDGRLAAGRHGWSSSLFHRPPRWRRRRRRGAGLRRPPRPRARPSRRTRRRPLCLAVRRKTVRRPPSGRNACRRPRNLGTRRA